MGFINQLIIHFIYDDPTNNYWLVVDLPLLKKNVSSSVGMMKFPTEWKSKSHVPNHQPVMLFTDHSWGDLLAHNLYFVGQYDPNLQDGAPVL